jgi:hypothetical protein
MNQKLHTDPAKSAGPVSFVVHGDSFAVNRGAGQHRDYLRDCS